MQHRELERLAGQRQRPDAGEHGQRHRPDLEHDEQDRNPQVLHPQVDEIEQRLEAAHHPGRREPRLGLQCVLDLGELGRHARRLLERHALQGEERVPRELRREAKRPGGIEEGGAVDEQRGGLVESSAGNGLRPPYQNGSSRSGDSNVPETLEAHRLVIRSDDGDRGRPPEAEGRRGARGQGDVAGAGGSPSI